MKTALLVLSLAAIGWSLFVALGAGRSTAIPATSASFAPISRTFPSSLWIGDSYPAGKGAPSAAQGESCLTASAMGWTCHLDAEGGTGYLADGHTNSADFGALASRLADDRRRYYADIIFLDAGRNEGGASAQARLAVALNAELSGVRRAWPKARVVVIVPYLMRTEFPSSYRAMFVNAAQRFHATALDPVAEGWMRPGMRSLTLSDGIPNAAGHRYIAQHLVSDLRLRGLARIPITDLPTSAAS